MNPFSARRYVIAGIILLVMLVFLIKLFFIQILDSSYKVSADNNSQRIIVQYPARGLIFDRNGKMIVSNQAAYDLMINPSQLKPFDTAELCRILDISVEQARASIDSAFTFARYQPSIFLKQVSVETFAVLQEQLYKYPGFYGQARTLRKYHTKGSAHLLGYVGEVDKGIVRKDPYYRQGDYIGISGMEKAYEQEIRGSKGQKILLVDVRQRVKGPFQNGAYDTKAEFGHNLHSTIDLELQEYAEWLMQSIRGSVVAIEPSTGEVLAIVSSPGYDPSLLVGRVRNEHYVQLSRDTLKPLFNRALMAKYPPGSTFKIINALIGLQEGVIDEHTSIGCSMGLVIGGMYKKCHSHISPLELSGSLQNSCNAYYFQTFKRIIEDKKYGSSEDAYNNWRELVVSFGFGSPLGTDFPNELGGFIPKDSYYNRYYGKKGWNAYTIISLGIGQGELGITPIQMANYASIIANRGYYYIPHSVSRVEGMELDARYREAYYAAIDSSYYKPVIEGMAGAVNGPGTGTALVAHLPGVIICGKTGTAQNPPYDDHSIFIAFAPKDNPKIAMSVYVENGGFGSTYAAPLASLMIEKYLNDTITRPWLEQKLINANLLNVYAKKR
jgi:penicillin-binding protein 2